MERNLTPQTSERPVQSFHHAAILLMDENPINNLLVQKMLSQQGYLVIATDNHVEARHILNTRRIDMILLDVRMQKNNGYDITKIAREKGKQSGTHIPIIALTDRVVKDQREKYLRNGIDEYLPKPIFEKELCRVIKKLNGNRCCNTSGEKQQGL